MSRRKLQEFDNVNTDLYIFNPITNENSVETSGPNRESYHNKHSQSNVALSTILEPGNGENVTANLQMTIPLNQHGSVMRNSKDYNSTLTANTRSLVVANNTVFKQELTQQRGRDSKQENDQEDLTPSRNLQNNTVNKQFSAPSTNTKIEFPSYGENIEDRGVDLSEHKMISPGSKMGQVFQKTNVPLHQRSNR